MEQLRRKAVGPVLSDGQTFRQEKLRFRSGKCALRLNGCRNNSLVYAADKDNFRGGGSGSFNIAHRYRVDKLGRLCNGGLTENFTKQLSVSGKVHFVALQRRISRLENGNNLAPQLTVFLHLFLVCNQLVRGLLKIRLAKSHNGAFNVHFVLVHQKRAKLPCDNVPRLTLNALFQLCKGLYNLFPQLLDSFGFLVFGERLCPFLCGNVPLSCKAFKEIYLPPCKLYTLSVHCNKDKACFYVPQNCLRFKGKCVQHKKGEPCKRLFNNAYGNIEESRNIVLFKLTFQYYGVFAIAAENGNILVSVTLFGDKAVYFGGDPFTFAVHISCTDNGGFLRLGHCFGNNRYLVFSGIGKQPCKKLVCGEKTLFLAVGAVGCKSKHAVFCRFKGGFHKGKLIARKFLEAVKINVLMGEKAVFLRKTGSFHNVVQSVRKAFA